VTAVAGAVNAFVVGIPALVFIIQLAPGDYLDTLKQNRNFARTVQNSGSSLDWIALGRSSMGGGCGDCYSGDFGTVLLAPSALFLRVGNELTPHCYPSVASLILTWAIAIPLGITLPLSNKTS